jgi:hypothetical protein
MRVLLVLALRGERRSFCKSVRLILFPLETNLHQPRVVGENNGRERVACSTRQRMKVRSSRGETTRDEGLEKVKLDQILKKGESFQRESLFGTVFEFFFSGTIAFQHPSSVSPISF